MQAVARAAAVAPTFARVGGHRADASRSASAGDTTARWRWRRVRHLL